MSIDLSIGSSHFKVTLAWLGWVAAAVFVFLFLKVGGGSTDAGAAIDSGKVVVTMVHKLVAGHQAYVRQSAAARKQLRDSLDRAIAAATELTSQANGLAAAARTAPQMREAARVFAQAGQVCMDGLTLCRHKSDSLATADSIHQDSLARGLVRAGAATQQVIAKTECHLVHVGPIKAFNCPSRLTSFKVGIAGGVGIVETIRLLLTGHL